MVGPHPGGRHELLRQGKAGGRRDGREGRRRDGAGGGLRPGPERRSRRRGERGRHGDAGLRPPHLARAERPAARRGGPRAGARRRPVARGLRRPRGYAPLGSSRRPAAPSRRRRCGIAPTAAAPTGRLAATSAPGCFASTTAGTEPAGAVRRPRLRLHPVRWRHGPSATTALLGLTTAPATGACPRPFPQPSLSRSPALPPKSRVRGVPARPGRPRPVTPAPLGGGAGGGGTSTAAERSMPGARTTARHISPIGPKRRAVTHQLGVTARRFGPIWKKWRGSCPSRRRRPRPRPRPGLRRGAPRLRVFDQLNG